MKHISNNKDEPTFTPNGAGNISVVMLCAGKGRRMLPLTESCPKPLQLINGKTLIEWKLEALPKEITDVILVIGYQGNQIQEFFGPAWKEKTIRYVEQKELNGTAGALLSAKPLLGERFLVMMGDDLYDPKDIKKLLSFEWGMCVMEVSNREIGGEILINERGDFIGIDEEKHFVSHGYVNTGLYMLRHKIFDISPVPIGGSSTEFGLPHTLAVIAKENPVSIVKTDNWMQITTPADLVSAEEFVTR